MAAAGGWGVGGGRSLLAQVGFDAAAAMLSIAFLDRICAQKVACMLIIDSVVKHSRVKGRSANLMGAGHERVN